MKYPKRSESLGKYLSCLFLAVMICAIALVNLQSGFSGVAFGFFVGGIIMAMRETSFRMKYKKAVRG